MLNELYSLIKNSPEMASWKNLQAAGRDFSLGDPQVTEEECPYKGVPMRTILYNLRLWGMPQEGIIRIMLWLYNRANSEVNQQELYSCPPSPKIYTHVNPDADSLACIWGFFHRHLGGVPQNHREFLRFVSADIRKEDLPEFSEGDEIWDLSCGTKGDSKECAFKRMAPLVEGVRREFVEEINEGDTTGSNSFSSFSLEDLRINTPEDLQSVIFVLAALIHGDRVKEKAQGRYSQFETFLTKGGRKILVLPSGIDHSGIPQVAGEDGCWGHIFQDGNNMGITRYPKETTPSLKNVLESAIQEQEPGWFFHPSGFLAAWGTKKAPKRRPSRISLEDIIQIVKDNL